MVDQQQSKRRWLPRFSVRTFLILVTLACGYAACWWPTKTRGVRDVHAVYFSRIDLKLAGNTIYREDGARIVAPLIVTISEIELSSQPRERSLYYFWFFGWVVKLPYAPEEPFLDTDGFSGAT